MWALRERRRVVGPRGVWEVSVVGPKPGHRPHGAAMQIQAVTGYEPEERLLWTTTDEMVEQVLDEIET